MAARRKHLPSSGREYQEPDPESLVRLSAEAWRAMQPVGLHRVKIIEKAGVVIEPLQEDVISYPPVVVRPDEIAASA